MKWFLNLKISAKLISTFVLVALIAGVVGVIGISGILRIDGNYTVLYNDYGVSLGNIGKAAVYFQRERVNLRDLLINDVEKRNEHIQNIRKYEQEVTKNLNQFNESLKTDSEKKEYKALLDSMAAYKLVLEKVVSLAQANKLKEAKSVIYNEGWEATQKVNDNIDGFFNNKVENGLKESGNNTKLTNATVVFYDNSH